MRMRKIGIGICAGIVVVSLAVFLFFMPVRIRVTMVTDRLYDGIPVQLSDIQIETASILGAWQIVDNPVLSQISDDGFLVCANGLFQRAQMDKIPVSFLAAEYQGLIYEGDEIHLEPSDVLVQAVYYDGHVKTLTDFQMSVQDDANTDIVSARISALGQTYQLDVQPVQITGLMMDYKDGLHVGDEFDSSKLQVFVRFADGMKRKVTDWTCDFEGVVALDSKIEVVSNQYGTDILTPDTSNIQDYQLTYTRPVYEGDILKPEDVKLTVVYTDDTTQDVTDLSFEEIRVFAGTKVSMKSDLFGSMSCIVNPIKVKTVQAACAATMNRLLVVQKLTLIYTDGHSRELPLKEVQMISDLSTPFSEGTHQLKFQWYDHEYAFSVTTF